MNRSLRLGVIFWLVSSATVVERSEGEQLVKKEKYEEEQKNYHQ